MHVPVIGFRNVQKASLVTTAATVFKITPTPKIINDPIMPFQKNFFACANLSVLLPAFKYIKPLTIIAITANKTLIKMKKFAILAIKISNSVNVTAAPEGTLN